MSANRPKPFDMISLIAAIATPIWIAFRLTTGGWGFRAVYLTIAVAIAVFYGIFVLRSKLPNDTDSESNRDTEAMSSQSKTSPIVVVAVGAAYVLILLIVVWAA
jgi:Na+-transporting methylmalonyl-CoA/oxaloacetate decarboxylase gamma subunit